MWNTREVKEAKYIHCNAQFESFVLPAVFIMDQSVHWNMEKSLKHWKVLSSLKQMQNNGKTPPQNSMGVFVQAYH